MLVTFNSVLT